MGFMGRILQNDQAINDVIAYINTLQPASDESVAASAPESMDQSSMDQSSMDRSMSDSRQY
jgi:hypothetical protein